MKPISYALIVLLLLITGTGWADTKQKKQQTAAHTSNEEMVAPTTELVDALKSVNDVVQGCSGKLAGDLILNNLKKDYALSSADRRIASDARVAIYAEGRKCKDSGKEKIREASGFVVSELGKRGLRELGKDYVVQAQTALEAIGDDELFSTEFSKLKSLRNRIELELSLMKDK